MAARSLQDELEALRRDLQAVMPDGDAAAEPPQNSDARSEVERVLSELQDRFGEAADEAGDIVVAHPFASVACAFLLGVLVANFMRGR